MININRPDKVGLKEMFSPKLQEDTYHISEVESFVTSSVSNNTDENLDIFLESSPGFLKLTKIPVCPAPLSPTINL